MDKQTLRVRAMQSIGNALVSEGDYAGAQASLQRAFNHAKADAQRASILNDMSWVMIQRGELETASQYAEEAIKICETQANNGPLRAQILDHLGTIAEMMKDLPKALSYHQQSFNIKQALGDVYAVAESANNLGVVYRSLENYPEALIYFKQSLESNKKIGHALGIAMSTLNMGNAYTDQDDLDNAIPTFRAALEMFRQMGHKQGMATCLDNLAACLEDSQDKDLARDYLIQAYDLYKEIGDAEGQARIQEVLSEGDSTNQ